jgi:hypothetical protein
VGQCTCRCWPLFLAAFSVNPSNESRVQRMMEEIAIINSRELRQQALFSLDVRIPRWYKGLHPVAAFSGRANSALP